MYIYIYVYIYTIVYVCYIVVEVLFGIHVTLITKSESFR